MSKKRGELMGNRLVRLLLLLLVIGVLGYFVIKLLVPLIIRQPIG